MIRAFAQKLKGVPGKGAPPAWDVHALSIIRVALQLSRLRG